MPLRGIIGSDILAHRPDWKIIDNPLAGPGDPGGDPPSDPIVLLPAIAPDVALFHAPTGDAPGNVFLMDSLAPGGDIGLGGARARPPYPEPGEKQDRDDSEKF